jgi:hypothetical protein
MIGAYTLTIHFTSTTLNYSFHLTNVYAPPTIAKLTFSLLNSESSAVF